ncbi:cytochrome c oxidase assembly protein [Leekyejoonella antrihumi]|uniref:Cytochrome c oxidase assembly protein n=2 Tax=Leekyejoonella antrihumi TaxID=1660198 RepID=A0A563E4L5_9MICO|nr:cytochrome c oxidase assembly protein [Leekyejoonella antrihumi]
MGQHMGGPMWHPTLPMSLGRLLEWHPQPVPVMPLLCLAGLLLYGWGVWRLHRRGTRWPVGRTLSFLVGLALIVLVTATGIGGYGMQLFSVHMVQHMVLSMLAPIPLLMGAPITLALRAMPNTHGRAGAPRRALLRVLHSRFATVISSPLFSIPVFLFSLYGLYFTPIFDWMMSGFVGHEVMMIHFVAVGLLLFWPILAVDPSPHQQPPVLRIIELFITAPFHAFFGIAVMLGNTIIATYFAHPPMAWHISVMYDQKVGGAIAWGFSEIPTLLVVLAIAVLWSRSSDREGRRFDRTEDRAERTGSHSDLQSYNDYLARLGRRDH